MEWYKIPIFENFALVSIIMPYYGRADRAFLLLSQLSAGSRNKLDEYYREFRFVMKFNLLKLRINEKNIKRLSLPSDLFTFSILITKQELLIDFIRFVISINNLKGWYFRSHYLHEQLSIIKLEINSNFVDLIYPYIDKLRAVKVQSNKSCGQSLLDVCCLYNIPPTP